jgi:membrane associated rhomboid family serine protease
MLLIPVNVDVPLRRWPWMNWAMMGVIFLCFSVQWTRPEIMARFVLGIDGYESEAFSDSSGWAMFDDSPVDEHPLSWIGHMFLHADFFHLLGNLIFMWVFGNAVCAKVGNLLYPVLWLGTGLVAAAGERMFSDGPMLGASGAISGVMGFYIVFYLLNDITMFFLFFFRPITFSLSSFWVVGAYVALDILGTTGEGDGVAYIAHVAGTAAGFAAAVILVKTGVIEAEADERTLLDVLSDRSSNAGRRSKKRQTGGGKAVDRVLLMQRLKVHIGGGHVKEMLVAELLGRAGADVATNDMLVSANGQAWSSFGDWRKAHSC